MAKVAKTGFLLTVLCWLIWNSVVSSSTPPVCPESNALQYLPCVFYTDGWMDCAKKNLTSIPSDLPRCSRLLELTNNFITEIGARDLSGLDNAESLKFAHNRLKRIAVGAFADMRVLKKLFLNDNLITSLDDCTFQGLASATELNLQNNRIKRIGDRAFDGLPMLTILNIINNTISTLRSQWFQNKPHLTTLQDAYNTWNCTCDLRSAHRDVQAKFNLTMHCSQFGIVIFEQLCITCSYPSQLAGKKLHELTNANFSYCSSQTTPRPDTAATILGVTNTSGGFSQPSNSIEYCAAIIQQQRERETTPAPTSPIQTGHTPTSPAPTVQSEDPTTERPITKTTERPITKNNSISAFSTSPYEVTEPTTAPFPIWGIVLFAIGAVLVVLAVIALVATFWCCQSRKGDLTEKAVTHSKHKNTAVIF